MRAIVITYVMYIFECNSLKEKRMIRQSLIKRLQNKFNITVAETGLQDSLNRLEISIALVSNSYSFLKKEEQKILNFLESFGEFEITDIERFTL